MRRSRTTMAVALVATVVLAATACYPPSQTATTQPIPPGGRVVAVGPLLTIMQIQDALPDLSEILYQETDFLLTTSPIPQRFWVYDDHTGLTKRIPAGADLRGSAALSPDGRQVIFSSDDPQLQVDPTTPNCYLSNYPYNPVDTPVVCTELYLFDLDTGQVRQLTGLNGSSTMFHWNPTFTPDGQSVEYSAYTGGWTHQSPTVYQQLNLATGQITDVAPFSPPPTSWDRGTHTVSWDANTGTLTSTDATTGEVTSLWSDPYWSLASATDNGRLIVLGDWVTGQEEIFRLIDTDTGTVRTVSTQWISQDGTKYAVAQQNVSPDATDRLIIAPLPPA